MQIAFYIVPANIQQILHIRKDNAKSNAPLGFPFAVQYSARQIRDDLWDMIHAVACILCKLHNEVPI